MCLKKLMTTKESYLCEKFIVSNLNFTAEHVKIVENSRFFKFFF